MTAALNRLAEIAGELKRGEQPEPETVRTLLGWFDAQRRGYHVNSVIERALAEHGVNTLPDFRYAYIDSRINFVPAAVGSDGETATSGEQTPATDGGNGGAPVVVAPEKTTETTPVIVTTVGGTIEDPTYRIGRLKAANKLP